MIRSAECWQVLRGGCHSPAENMAVDEALLLSANERGIPCLRLYSWREAAATFGYFQRYDRVAESTELRPLIRRPTGGGLVPHERDWTYSVVIPTRHEWYSLSACESYCRLHRWVVTSLQTMGLRSELAPEFQDGAGQCFAGHEANDVLVDGCKVAGAAQRRNKLGLLVQGSVQPNVDWERSQWETAMVCCAESEWGVSWCEMPESEVDEAVVQRLIAEKYADEKYLRRR